MDSRDVLAIREFRRFANMYVYPEIIGTITEKIKYYMSVDELTFTPTPQPVIKFHSNLQNNNQSQFTELLHSILKVIFINLLNEYHIIKIIRNKIHTEVFDNEMKDLLNYALSELQIGNVQFVSLLFNITILRDNNVYLYL